MGGMNEAEVVVLEDRAKAAEAQLLRMLCNLLQMTPEDLMRLKERVCAVPKLEAQCQQVQRLVGKACCVGNVQYSQISLDEYSDKSTIAFDEVVKDMGPDFVNSLPMAPGKAIRLTHAARPGFAPTQISLDASFANGGTNYLDLKIQFYLVPASNPNVLGKPIGQEMEGSDFLSKNGTQTMRPFPTYRNEPIIVGSAERLAVVIRHRGAANNLDSLSIKVHHDNRAWFVGCCAECGRGESCACWTRPQPRPYPPVG